MGPLVPQDNQEMRERQGKQVLLVYRGYLENSLELVPPEPQV